MQHGYNMLCKPLMQRREFATHGYMIRYSVDRLRASLVSPPRPRYLTSLDLETMHRRPVRVAARGASGAMFGPWSELLADPLRTRF
jgi:hypothetical protein